ncbi:membrane protein insertase YidC [Geminicoccaceae bacterium 1502E]|nr:membrane protein insertase YidC [Geminicoccaceae bacterium 1502E]
MTEQRNLILAIVLSVGIILAFQFFYGGPAVREAQQGDAPQTTAQETVTPQPGVQSGGAVPGQVPGVSTAAEPPADRKQVLASVPRIPIDNGRVHGSISTVGSRIDDVTLADYHASVDRQSPEIVLLSPPGSAAPYFAELGWVAGQDGTAVPGAETQWQAEGQALRPDSPVTLSWDNGTGLRFAKQFAIDENYMFTVSRSVTNAGEEPVTLYPYGLVSRWGTPETLGYYILHEGPIGVLAGSLKEPDYDDLQEDRLVEFDSTGGWLGFTDKYWLTSLVPAQDRPIKASFRHTMGPGGQHRYQSDFLGEAVTVAPGQTVEITDRLFAGAKEVDKLDAYEERYGVPLFDRAVDFGWFYFLTKPIFHVLDFFYKLVGNYGVAILLLTLVVKILFFPLANKSYKAMSQMKKLQPEMMKLRERHGDDRAKMNQELMELYRREKVNPMSGCLPILVQIPVFFALYKVLFVNIEMRHAPFFGWINDLSAPDPTTIFNLFGLLPFEPPAMLMIGVWPLLMGLTMWLQQRLNPKPADPTQAKVMNFLPVMFTFLFATFPAGLVVYWTWNNTLSILQQWVIMRRMGVKAG